MVGYEIGWIVTNGGVISWRVGIAWLVWEYIRTWNFGQTRGGCWVIRMGYEKPYIGHCRVIGVSDASGLQEQLLRTK